MRLQSSMAPERPNYTNLIESFPMTQPRAANIKSTQEPMNSYISLSMNSALQTAEIVECILKHVGGLKHCLTVNKLWFHESARVIWKSIKFSRLNDIGDLERQQVYANVVTRLCGITSLPPSYTIPSQLKFPVLQSVDISNSKISEESLYPLLVPRLSHLWLDGSDISDQFLLDLVERCPELRDFTLSGSPKLTSAGLQKFLVMTRCSSLTLICIRECIEWETLCKIAENKFIKELEIPKCDEHAISQVLKLVKHPFPNLTSFTSNFQGSVEDLLYPLLHMIKNLEYISIDGHDADMGALTELAKHKNLKYVYLSVTQPTSVANQVVDDEWLDEFTRFTPSLKELYLDGFPTQVTSKGLRAIGRNCPAIKDLSLLNEQRRQIRIPINKDDFPLDLPCLFPKLVWLDIYGQLFLDNERIVKHFPHVVENRWYHYGF